MERAGRSYVCELAHGIGLDSDVVLLELLLDLVDAGGNVLGLEANKGEAEAQTPGHDWQRLNSHSPTETVEQKKHKVSRFGVKCKRDILLMCTT